MADAPDDDFTKELAAAFDADEAADAPKADIAADDATPAEGEKDAPVTPETPKDGEPTTPPADPAQPAEGDPTAPQAPETPATPEEPAKPLTLDDIKTVINDVRTEERTSGQALDTATKEVMDAYYPDGLSNVLVDQASGKELRTPQDVVDASNGELTTEQASQWLMNEQYKLDQNIAKIKDDAKAIAETTMSFKRDSMAAVEKYDPLFKWQPHLQQKAFDLLMRQVKTDEAKGVVLSAPDVMDLYDTYLEPYRMAFEFQQKQSATNPVAAPAAAPAPVPTPGVNDRLDEGGDAGATPPDDPNDFAQQVSKELAKGI